MKATKGCPCIFISHASEDSRMADAVKSWIKLAYNSVNVFLSSANGIHCGENPDKTLTNAIQNADVLILLLTPISTGKPWLVFEAGGVFGRKKTVLPILCNGVTLEKVPSPIRQLFQVKDTKSRDEFTDFLNKIDSAVRQRHAKSGEGLRAKLKKRHKTPRTDEALLELEDLVSRFDEFRSHGSDNHPGFYKWRNAVLALLARQLGSDSTEYRSFSAIDFRKSLSDKLYKTEVSEAFIAGLKQAKELLGKILNTWKQHREDNNE